LFLIFWGLIYFSLSAVTPDYESRRPQLPTANQGSPNSLLAANVIVTAAMSSVVKVNVIYCGS
jgi:hypothetical protein